MDELNPTGANEEARERAKFIRQRQEQKESQGASQQKEETQQPQTTDHLMVDGQDLRNHPQFEELRLDIPWSKEEEKGEYPLDVYDRALNEDSEPDGKIDPIDNPWAIWIRRKHALTEEGHAGIETANAIKKGGLRLVSSVLTAPERYLDMATGEMQNIGGQLIDKRTNKPYTPDWDPLGDIKDPWLNSWWGNITHGAVKYGVGGALAAKIPGIAGLPVGSKLLASEGLVAAISEYSQGDNLTGQIAERVPWTRAVFLGLASGDYDHPLVLTFKNVLEEMGLGKLFGVIASKFGASDYAKTKADNVDAQIKEKGKLELKEELEFDKTQRKLLPGGTVKGLLPESPLTEFNPHRSGFRGHKNKPFSQPGQGSPASTGEPFDIHKQLNRTEDWGNEFGGTDSPMTPVAAQRGAQTSGFGTKFLREQAKKLLSDSQYKGLIREARENKQSFEQLFRPAFRRYQEVMGRHATATSTEDFWKPISEKKPFQTGDGVVSKNYKAWAMENVVVADLVNGALFRQLRDLNIAARELRDSTDVFAVDGLMDSVRDRLTFGLANVKRSRYLISTEFSKLKGPTGVLTPKAQKAIRERTVQLHTESKEAVDMMMKMLKEGQTDELAEAVMDVFSMQNKVQNWMDFDKWMVQKLRGGEFKGKVKTGQMIREIQGVFVNSILSGPKTPLRAMIGTTANSYLSSLHNLIGATMRIPFTGDFRLAQAAARNTYGMFEILPDSWKVFKASLNSNFGKNVDNLETRFSSRQRLNDQRFEAYGQWAETRGEWNDKMAFRIANSARWLNDRRWATWSPRVLASTDETFKYIMAKARSKELAFTSVYDDVANGRFTEITPELLRRAEDVHYNRYLDEAGDLDITKDLYLDKKFKEATLTEDLSGFSKRLEGVFQNTPWARPFFLFARTGVNGLKMNMKNTPLLGALMKESRDILMHSGDDFGELAMKYGIENADDLARQRNLIIGRQAMGNTIVMMAAAKYLEGGLTGSGPANRSQRQLWLDTGWERNTIELGGVRVGYETFEPYNTILQSVANIGDNMQLMGPEWAEDNLSRLAFSITASLPDVVSKSYMQGLSQFVDLFTADPGASVGKIAGNLANNTVPLSSLRNEVGKILNPRMRELNKGIFDSIRNRNLSSELLTLDGGLPIKSDLLNGDPLRDWNFFERMWNATSPVTLSLKPSKGRTLLHNSQYDLRLSVLSTPNDGPSLAKEPVVRSLFIKAIGDYRDSEGKNLEQKLNILAEQPNIQRSVELMYQNMRKGEWNVDPMKGYKHNIKIKEIFNKARDKAWAKVLRSNHPDVIRIMQEHKQQKIDTNKLRNKTSTYSANVEKVRQLNNP